MLDRHIPKARDRNTAATDVSHRVADRYTATVAECVGSQSCLAQTSEVLSGSVLGDWRYLALLQCCPRAGVPELMCGEPRIQPRLGVGRGQSEHQYVFHCRLASESWLLARKHPMGMTQRWRDQARRRQRVRYRQHGFEQSLLAPQVVGWVS